MQDPASELRRIPLLRRWVNSADAALKPLGASRSLRPSQARNLLPPPSLPGLRCSGQTSPLNVRRIGGVAMAGKPALASVPVTQEPYRNRDCEDSRAHSFCHAKYTHVSQTLWRGLWRQIHFHGFGVTRQGTWITSVNKKLVPRCVFVGDRGAGRAVDVLLLL